MPTGLKIVLACEDTGLSEELMSELTQTGSIVAAAHDKKTAYYTISEQIFDLAIIHLNIDGSTEHIGAVWLTEKCLNIGVRVILIHDQVEEAAKVIQSSTWGYMATQRGMVYAAGTVYGAEFVARTINQFLQIVFQEG